MEKVNKCKRAQPLTAVRLRNVIGNKSKNDADASKMATSSSSSRQETVSTGANTTTSSIPATTQEHVQKFTKCSPLPDPIPKHYKDGMKISNESNKDKIIPNFLSLLNFTSNPRITPNQWTCVMCGNIRTTCGSRKFVSSPKDDPMIPIKNRGVCTECDNRVWIVHETQQYIKWCRGCRTFLPRACFGNNFFGSTKRCEECKAKGRNYTQTYREKKNKMRLQSNNDDDGSCQNEKNIDQNENPESTEPNASNDHHTSSNQQPLHIQHTLLQHPKHQTTMETTTKHSIQVIQTSHSPIPERPISASYNITTVHDNPEEDSFTAIKIPCTATESTEDMSSVSLSDAPSTSKSSFLSSSFSPNWNNQSPTRKRSIQQNRYDSITSLGKRKRNKTNFFHDDNNKGKKSRREEDDQDEISSSKLSKKDIKEQESYEFESCKVAKYFDGDLFYGEVIGYNKKEKWWMIKYEDDDKEEVGRREVQRIIKEYDKLKMDKKNQKPKSSTDFEYKSSSVAKYFDGSLYYGQVTGFDKTKGWYMVEYEDGDSEEVTKTGLKQMIALYNKKTQKKSAHYQYSDSNLNQDDGNKDKHHCNESDFEFKLQKVAKHFDDGVFEGAVIDYDAENEWWMIEYEDGDTEEVNRKGLLKLIKLYEFKKAKEMKKQKIRLKDPPEPTKGSKKQSKHAEKNVQKNGTVKAASFKNKSVQSNGNVSNTKSNKKSSKSESSTVKHETKQDSSCSTSNTNCNSTLSDDLSKLQVMKQTVEAKKHQASKMEEEVFGATQNGSLQKRIENLKLQQLRELEVSLFGKSQKGDYNKRVKRLEQALNK